MANPLRCLIPILAMLLLAIVLLACTGGHEAEPGTAAAPAAGARQLVTPLPGNVLPPFPYHLAADVELAAGMIRRRRIHLDVPGLELDSAVQQLAGQWRDAGLDGSDIQEGNGRITAELWLPGDNGARGLMAPSYGGLYVLLVGLIDDDSGQPQLQITVHSP
ncbi:MAG: hypothetical protein M0Q42_11950 [Xanthomonadales bacterium]|nr:hypothetical protein [Xanthomonadales bacterium]